MQTSASGFAVLTKMRIAGLSSSAVDENVDERSLSKSGASIYLVSCAEVGLFGSSILWPVLCSVLFVGEIAPPLASSPGRCSCSASGVCFSSLLAEVIACHLRQLVHEASADITCG